MKISELEVLTTPSDDDLIIVDAKVISESFYDTRVMRREDFLAGYVKIDVTDNNGESLYSASEGLAGYLDQYLESKGVVTSGNFNNYCSNYVTTNASDIAQTINPYLSTPAT